MLFVAIVVAVVLGQTPTPRKTKPFIAKDYPEEKFRISKNDYALGETTVRLINVKNLGYVEHPEYCSVWIEILRPNQLVRRFYYGDIEPVGFSFGAFVPRQQAVPGYFVVVKEGDYDGRLLATRMARHMTCLAVSTS